MLAGWRSDAIAKTAGKQIVNPSAKPKMRRRAVISAAEFLKHFDPLPEFERHRALLNPNDCAHDSLRASSWRTIRNVSLYFPWRGNLRCIPATAKSLDQLNGGYPLLHSEGDGGLLVIQ